MIPPSQQGPTQLESGNFFQRSGADYSRNIDEATKIQKISQDAHTLHKLAQSYDIDQFLNKPSIDSTSSASDRDISAVVTLAANISQALDEIVRSVPRRQISEDGDTEHKATQRSRSPQAHSIEPVSIKQCYTCGVTETPCWRRSAPDSPLLCNVCSLVQSKRAIRKRSGSRSASVFTRISHP